MYMLGSIAISVAVPDATLELTSGASQAFTVYADGFGIPGLSNVLSGLLVLGAVAASIAWIAGPSRSMWLVGRAGYLPQRFQKVNKNDVQMPILLFQGVIVTILSLVFVVAPNTSVAFAMLQDISIILYMLMYVCMFAVGDQAPPLAAGRRASDPDHGLPVIAIVGILAALSAIVLGLTPPAGFSALSAGPVRRGHRGRCRASSPSPPSCCTTSAGRSGPASTRRRSRRSKPRSSRTMSRRQRRDQRTMIDLATYTPMGDKKNSDFFEEYLPRVYDRREQSGLNQIVGNMAAVVVQVEHGDGVDYMAELAAMGPYRFQAARLTDTHKVYVLQSQPEFPRLIVLEPLDRDLRGQRHPVEHALPAGPQEAERALHRRGLPGPVHARRSGTPWSRRTSGSPTPGTRSTTSTP